MREVLPELVRWWEAGATVGVGTVIGTFRSAPRPPGAAMLVGPDGSAVGSVSGGCVEGAVYELAEAARAGGPPVLQRYGVSDDDAFTVGLTCGGIIDVFVEAISRQTFPEFGTMAASIATGEPVALATVIAGREDQLGAAHKHLVEEIFKAEFADAKVFESVDAARLEPGILAIFEPRIEQFSFASANDEYAGSPFLRYCTRTVCAATAGSFNT